MSSISGVHLLTPACCSLSLSNNFDLALSLLRFSATRTRRNWASRLAASEYRESLVSYLAFLEESIWSQDAFSCDEMFLPEPKPEPEPEPEPDTLLHTPARSCRAD